MKTSDKETLQIGIIGFGDMGKLYGNCFLKAGWKNVNVCDLPTNYESLKEKYTPLGFNVFKDGYGVARVSDFVMFSVEATYINSVVQAYGPAMKLGAIACGQTSVKAPEIKAFEEHLPSDVDIVTCHSLHGPVFEYLTIGSESQRATPCCYTPSMHRYNQTESNVNICCP
jgi:prephenate dehydrogenase (NADP+)